MTAGVRIAGSAIHLICELRLLRPSPHPESGESDAISSIALRLWSFFYIENAALVFQVFAEHPYSVLHGGYKGAVVN